MMRGLKWYVSCKISNTCNDVYSRMSQCAAGKFFVDLRTSTDINEHRLL